MNSTPINTVGQLKKVIATLERHQCIGNQTPIKINGGAATVQFKQETEVLLLTPLEEASLLEEASFAACKSPKGEY